MEKTKRDDNTKERHKTAAWHMIRETQAVGGETERQEETKVAHRRSHLIGESVAVHLEKQAERKKRETETIGTRAVA